MDSRWLGNLLAALSLAVQDEVERSTEEAVAYGASAPAALVTLHAEPGISIEQLRNALSLTHSGGVRLVDRLAGDGHLERMPGFGRQVALELTVSGRRLAEQILAARAHALERVLAPLEESQRRRLAALLEPMVRGLVGSEARSWQICRMCDTDTCTPENCPVEAELREHPL
jgi:MarR family transcriptional regulator, negative regulator of the multidrug operon emrRAB